LRASPFLGSLGDVTPFSRLQRTAEDVVVGAWFLVTLASPLLGLGIFAAGFAREVQRVGRRRERAGS
jgi:hypothetical protein